MNASPYDAVYLTFDRSLLSLPHRQVAVKHRLLHRYIGLPPVR